MARSKPLIVMNMAGLSHGLLFSGGCPNLERYARTNHTVPVRPVLPALTLPMQATFITGVSPADHGIVGNGFYDRTFLEHRFWCASSGLLDHPPFWRGLSGKGIRTAALFWWSCLGSGVDTYLNVSPIHGASGETIPSCYSDPPGLYPLLAKRLGPFPLHRFWGPAVSIESSAWILAATLEVVREGAHHAVLSYLPHMDYSLQRSGPGSEEALRHLGELDRLLQEPLSRAREGEFELMILSEYGISPVKRAVSPNRIFQEADLFRVREVAGRWYPDLPGSRAFAICDHQVAHIYVKDPEDRQTVKKLIADVKGVEAVLDEDGKFREGIHHDRSGDLLAVAAEDAWFEYAWWPEPGVAPDYAFNVDIHRKIGYDPLELIYEPEENRIATDPARIKGSHGRIPENQDDDPVVVIPLCEKKLCKADRSISALDVSQEIVNILEGA